MATESVQSSREAWALARRQHGVIARCQLVELGFSPAEIRHRLATGRLHRVAWNVYAVGRPQLGEPGRWMAATLRCGPGAVLSHGSAAAAWKIRRERDAAIEVSVELRSRPRAAGIRIHRRRTLPLHRIRRVAGIPLTDPTLTLTDLAGRLPRGALEAAINEADKLELISPEALRVDLEQLSRQPGVAALRRCLDRDTFRLTDSELERRFLPIVRAAGLPLPLTRQRVNGYRTDFYWPVLGLVVETDGLRYHRTPAQQARDRRRDQAHARAGSTALRFTHAQVRFEPEEVRETLATVAGRLADPRGSLT